MRIARIRYEGSEHLARVDGETAVPLDDTTGRFDVLVDRRHGTTAADGPGDHAGGSSDAPPAPGTGTRSGNGFTSPVALSNVELLAPIADPGSVIAVGLNYVDHAKESGLDIPLAMVTFPKLPQSIIGAGETIRWSPAQSDQVDYEAELALIIGTAARDVTVENALDHVLGYTCCNDVSARDAQFSDGQWMRSKSFDTFCPLGPWLVTPDEIPDPQSLSISCRVNGQTLQDSNTSQMIFGVAEIISYLSRFFTLRPGDVITTGTPAGVGFARNPPIYLHDGDTVEVDIEGIGVLTNGCGPL